jgi:hypothetical protein
MAKGGLLQKVGQALASVGIKAPWKVGSRPVRPGYRAPYLPHCLPPLRWLECVLQLCSV